MHTRTEREMVPLFSYRMENDAHCQPQMIPGNSNITDMEDLGQIEGGKKPGQVIKDVNILYLLDPQVKHKPGRESLRGHVTCTHACLPLPQVFCCKLWTVQRIQNLISVVINNFCYYQGNTVLQETFCHLYHMYKSPNEANLELKHRLMGNHRSLLEKEGHILFQTNLWTIMKQKP